MVLPAVETSSGIRVDFIFSMTSYEKEAIQRATKIQILGQQVSFASPEDLIIHKIFAGRPRDLEDVRSVLIRNEGLDVRHIRKWLKEFEISSEKKDLLKSFEQILTESRA
jgi:predicted nucleotidyltransferase